MKKILIGTVGILLYKYLPRSITFMPLGVSKAILCIAMIIGYFLLDENLRNLIKHKFSYIKFFFCGIGLWAVQSILMTFLLTFIEALFGWTMPVMLNEQNVMSPWLYVPIAVILGPLTEEFLFRGLFQEGLSGLSDHKVWQVITIILTSVFFGILHPIPAQKVSAFITGLVFGFVYYKKKDIRYGCMLHIGNNFMATMLSYILTAVII